jgi:hypothetical protein
VSQERQLSRRVMHFTEKQLFWKCYSRIACESYAKSIPASAMAFESRDSGSLKMQTHEMRNRGDTSIGTDPTPRISMSGIDFDLYISWGWFLFQYPRYRPS